MKLKLATLVALTVLGATSAHAAADYLCKVTCDSGPTNVVIQANSSSEAAKKMDSTSMANQICQETGKGKASTSPNHSTQCKEKGK